MELGWGGSGLGEPSAWPCPAGCAPGPRLGQHRRLHQVGPGPAGCEGLGALMGGRVPATVCPKPSPPHPLHLPLFHPHIPWGEPGSLCPFLPGGLGRGALPSRGVTPALLSATWLWSPGALQEEGYCGRVHTAGHPAPPRASSWLLKWASGLSVEHAQEGPWPWSPRTWHWVVRSVPMWSRGLSGCCCQSLLSQTSLSLVAELPGRSPFPAPCPQDLDASRWAWCLSSRRACSWAQRHLWARTAERRDVVRQGPRGPGAQVPDPDALRSPAATTGPQACAHLFSRVTKASAFRLRATEWRLLRAALACQVRGRVGAAGSEGARQFPKH